MSASLFQIVCPVSARYMPAAVVIMTGPMLQRTLRRRPPLSNSASYSNALCILLAVPSVSLTQSDEDSNPTYRSPKLVYLRSLGPTIWIDQVDWLDRTVRVPNVSGLSLEEWIAEYRRLKKLNEEVMSTGSTAQGLEPELTGKTRHANKHV